MTSRTTTTGKPTISEVSPPEKRPSAGGEPIRLCGGGDACPAVAEIGLPEKLARRNKDDLCHRCRTRRADEIPCDLEARRRGGAPRADVG